MSRSLIARLNVTVERFEWSGRNTHRARVRAAMALASRIEQIGDEIVVIVAHSHGGNVALAAARLAPLTDRARALVALGTPFLTSGKQVERLPSLVVTLGAGGIVSSILAVIGVVPPAFPLALGGLASFHLAANLYSLISRYRLPAEALDAMVGFAEDQFAPVDREEDVFVPASFEPAQAPTYRGHRRDFAAVSTEIVAYPSDEAGSALAVGQFVGMLSGALARVLNAITRGMSLSVWVVISSVVIGLIGLLVVAVAAIPVLAFVEAGDLPTALDRLLAMRDAEWSFEDNPAFDLAESVFPGWIQQVRDRMGKSLPAVWPIVRVVALVVVAPLVILSLLFAMLLIEALTIGFDGASFIWRHPITAVSVPVGRSHVSLLPVPSIGSGGLAHGHLTTSPEAVGAVADAVDRLLTAAGST